VHLQRLDRVRAAAREEAAGRGKTGRDPSLVAAEQRDQRSCRQPAGAHDRLPAARRRTARRPESRSSASVEDGASAAGGRARTMSCAPGGRAARRFRTRWRSRRVTRCRVTEPPTARLTTKPARAGASASGEFAVERCTTSRGRPARKPRRTAEANSSRWVSREPAGSTGAAPLRPRAARGPCGGDRRRWRVRRGCASAAESRAYAPGGGCSAGRCACPCSLLDSPGRRRGAGPAAALLLVWTDTRFFRADTHRGTPDTGRKPRVNHQRTQRRESRSNRPPRPSHAAGRRLWPCRVPLARAFAQCGSGGSSRPRTARARSPRDLIAGPARTVLRTGVDRSGDGSRSDDVSRPSPCPSAVITRGGRTWSTSPLTWSTCGTW
jgi:hypothetical protein